MGTYGVTQIKKGNEIIPLSDSYDGYFSAMGLATLLSIKYMSDSTLNRLFDSYTAHKLDTDEQEATSRQINEAIFQVSEDTQADKDAQEWIKQALSDDIRTSVTGFGPLLYLNIHPHYGRDYDYFDYLVDLDKREFEYSRYPISFDTIRTFSPLALTFFGNEEDLSFGTNEEQPQFSEIAYEYSEALEASDLVRAAELKAQLDNMVKEYQSIEPAKIEAFYAKQEAQRQEYLNQKKNQNKDSEDNEENNYGAYSIRNAQNISAPALRTVMAFCDRLAKATGTAKILLENADWGLSENYQEAGIRFFSPMSNNQEEHDCFDSSMQVIENLFKVRFNIFSSTGSWSRDVEQDESSMGQLFQDTSPGPEKSLFTLDEVKNDPDWQKALNEVWPNLAYHMEYEDTRKLVLDKKGDILSPVIWTYLALLRQDEALFSCIYPFAQKQLANVPEAEKVQALDQVYKTYLTSLSDGILITDSINSLVGENGLVPNQDNAAFIQFLKNTDFFTDIESRMNKSEKATYLGTAKKNSPK